MRNDVIDIAKLYAQFIKYAARQAVLDDMKTNILLAESQSHLVVGRACDAGGTQDNHVPNVVKRGLEGVHFQLFNDFAHGSPV